MLMTATALLRYGLRMRLVPKLILATACVSFLTITLSGFHLHADATTHDRAAPHGHVHSYAASPELDEGHIDIPVFESAADCSDGETVALIPTLIELEPGPLAGTRLAASRHTPRPQRHPRWRPELRGPPFHA